LLRSDYLDYFIEMDDVYLTRYELILLIVGLAAMIPFYLVLKKIKNEINKEINKELDT
jgi:hypothetical protein